MNKKDEVDWVEVVKAANSYPEGVVAYLRDHGISNAAYYYHRRVVTKKTARGSARANQAYLDLPSDVTVRCSVEDLPRIIEILK